MNVLLYSTFQYNMIPICIYIYTYHATHLHMYIYIYALDIELTNMARKTTKLMDTMSLIGNA